MSVQVLPSVDDCHLIIAPVWPLKLIVVLVPLQIGLAVGLANPAIVAGLTVTVATLELSALQTPLCTTARNSVLTFRLPVGSGLAVEAMSVQVLPSVDDCHLIIAP